MGDIFRSIFYLLYIKTLSKVSNYIFSEFHCYNRLFQICMLWKKYINPYYIQYTIDDMVLFVDDRNNKSQVLKLIYAIRPT